MAAVPKTPSQLLEEVSVKLKKNKPELEVKYDFPPPSGTPDNRKFTCIVMFHGFTANGEASKKKIAQHDAATKLLTILQKEIIEIEPLVTISEDDDFVIVEKSVLEISEHELRRGEQWLTEVKCRITGVSKENVVGDLQELCTRQIWPQPVYTSHRDKQNGIVECIVTVGRLHYKGIADNLNNAKKLAAGQMKRDLDEMLLKNKSNKTLVGSLSNQTVFEICDKLNSAELKDGDQHDATISTDGVNIHFKVRQVNFRSPSDVVTVIFRADIVSNNVLEADFTNHTISLFGASESITDAVEKSKKKFLVYLQNLKT